MKKSSSPGDAHGDRSGLTWELIVAHDSPTQLVDKESSYVSARWRLHEHHRDTAIGLPHEPVRNGRAPVVLEGHMTPERSPGIRTVRWVDATSGVPQPKRNRCLASRRRTCTRCNYFELCRDELTPIADRARAIRMTQEDGHRPGTAS